MIVNTCGVGVLSSKFNAYFSKVFKYEDQRQNLKGNRRDSYSTKINILSFSRYSVESLRKGQHPSQCGSVNERQPINQEVRVFFPVRAYAQVAGSIPSAGES